MQPLSTSRLTDCARVSLAVLLMSSSALASPPPPKQPEPASPAAIVDAFYAFHFKHDMGFTAKAVEARLRWLTPALIELCRDYFAHPTWPDEVPAVNGDPFTDSQEYPTSYSVGKAKVSGDRARVRVEMRRPGSRPREIEVKLVLNDGWWLIDDVGPTSGPSLRALIAPKR